MALSIDTTKLALVYPRQSSQDQVDNNIYSLERQMQLREQAMRDGFPEDQIIVIADDLGLSGRSIEKRPGFSRALKMIGQGAVAAIYVEDLTRLSRDERTIDQMIIADECEKGGVLIYMGRSWYDMRDGGQRQSYKYQAVGASEYWKSHMTKLYENHRWKAMQGKAAAKPPVGYRPKRDVPKNHPDRDRLQVHEEEAAVIRALVAKLPEAGSVRGLHRMTYPTYWPDGSVVTFAILQKVLKNPMYRGTYVWGTVQVENAHEPIILPEQAAMIDHLTAVNRATKRKKSSSDGAVFSGLVYCPTCDGRIYSSASAGQPTYRCESFNQARERSHHFSVRSSYIDAMVMEDLWTRFQAGYVDSLIGVLQEQKAARAVIIDLGESTRRILQRKVDGLSKSLADPDVSEIARKVLLQQLDQAARDLELAEKQMPISPSLDADLAFYEALRKDKDFHAILPLTWDDEPLEWRRSWVRRFIRRVEIEQIEKGRSKVTVHYLDGSQSTLGYRVKASVQPEELAALRALWERPDRPKWGWAQWLADKMQEQGFSTNRRRVFLMMNRAQALALVSDE